MNGIEELHRVDMRTIYGLLDSLMQLWVSSIDELQCQVDVDLLLEWSHFKC